MRSARPRPESCLPWEPRDRDRVKARRRFISLRRLAVAPARMKESMQKRGSGRVRDFALYGETTGETDEFGLPIRYKPGRRISAGARWWCMGTRRCPSRSG